MDMDFDDLLNAAGKISGTINNAVSAIGKLKELARTEHYPSEIAALITALSVEVVDSKLELASLQTKIMELQRLHRESKKLEERKRNYVLSNTPTGEHVYRLKDDADTGEPPHAACPDCWRDDIVILQLRGSALLCTRCEQSYAVKKVPNTVRLVRG